MVNGLKKLVSKEPALITGVVVSALVWGAGQLGIVLDEANLQEVLTPLVTALAARFFVSPANKNR